jgi:hypothetical protein
MRRMRSSGDVEPRVRAIATILVEESVARYLLYEHGVTLEGEAAMIELVRASNSGPQDLPGYLAGIAPRADPESLTRAAERILAEVG